MGHCLKLTRAVLCLMVFLPALPARTPECFYGWTGFGHSYYLLVKDWQTMQSAQTSCQMLGGNLARIDDQQENEFVRDLMKKQGANKAWLGMTDLVRVGLYQWIIRHEASAEYINFDHGQPNGEQERCVTVYSSGKWHDYKCDTKHYFVCEM